MAKDKKNGSVGNIIVKVEQLYNTKQYDKALTLLSDTVLRQYKSAKLYNYKGNLYIKKGNPKEALNYYKKSIAISERAEVLYNAGLASALSNEIEGSVDYFSKSIRVKKDFLQAYADRGVSYRRLGNIEKALSDYNFAVSHGLRNARLFNNRGIAYELLQKKEEALTDFEEALKIDPNYIIAQKNIERLLHKTNSSLKLFTEILSQTEVPTITKSKIHKILSTCKSDIIDKIRAIAGKTISQLIGEQVVHYTKLFVADKIVNNDTKKLRYYNAIYMNDPEEGQVILECLDKKVQSAFHKANTQQESNIYIGSFLPAKQHQDELVMWRTYGKDENQVEGAGCSITINSAFFDDYNDSYYISPELTSNDETLPIAHQNLFRVLYYNKNHDPNKYNKFECTEGKEIETYINKLDEQLLELTKLKDNRVEDYSDKDKAIDKIIYHLISEIRFFFKSSDYSFENEVRVLQYADKSSNLLKIDERNTLPKKVYIESNKEIQPYIERITLGPKVPNPKQWLYMDIAMRQNNPDREKPVEFIISERKYQ